jgi:DNA-binding CsgD family transcriptional regulator
MRRVKRSEQARKDLLRLCNRGLDVGSFFAQADDVLKATAGFDGCCWMTMDPATHLPTSHVAHDSIKPQDVPRLAENEFMEEDVNKFSELARKKPSAATLRAATEGKPERSARYRDLLVPNGFDDELRTSFVAGSACWGGAAMYRAKGRPAYEPADVAFLAEIAPHVAEGLRRAILIQAIPTEEAEDAPGLVLLSADNSVESITPAALRWLSEVLSVSSDDGEQLPNVVYAVASRARFIGRGGNGSAGVARTRIQTPAGRWLILHGSLLDGGAGGRAAVIVEPARSPEIAPLIVEAYGLTERERDVIRLVIQGLSTTEIASTLFLSPYTVQDHLKAIFEKVGVRSRRELVAQVFFQHYAPRMARGANLAADGWFAAPAA